MSVVMRERERELEDGTTEMVALPHKWVICDQCEGEGRCLHPAIAEHAYSEREFREEFDEDERREYFAGGRGMYGVHCEPCDGTGKVLIPDEERWPEWAQKDLAEQHRWEREQRSEREMLARMGGDY